MALIGIEGFDHYNSGNSTDTAFDTGSDLPPAFVRNSRFGAAAGQSWSNTSGTRRYFWDVGSNQAHLFQGNAVEYKSAGGGSLFELYDSATIQCWLNIDGTNRRVQVYRGTGTTNLLGSSANNTLAPQTTLNYNYIEWEVTLNNSTGTIQVWVDNVQVLNLSGLDNCATANNFGTRVAITLPTSFTIDDYYAFDDTGTECNTRPGPCRVYTGYPTSDASVQFSHLSGTTNWEMADETGTQDNDTTYNFSGTAGQVDLFGTNLGVPGGATVLACEVRSTFRKDDVGARTARTVSKSNTVVTNGATINAGSTYIQSRLKHALNPDGNVAWTPTTANALQPGYEVTS